MSGELTPAPKAAYDIGSRPGEIGEIIDTFRKSIEQAGKPLTRREMEVRLTTMVQSCIIAPDVAAAVMVAFAPNYPRTITMEMLEAAWFAKCGLRAKVLQWRQQVKALEQRAADPAEIAAAKMTLRSYERSAPDEGNRVYDP